MAYATWSTASNRLVTERRLIPGLATGRTSKSVLRTSKRLSGQTYWPLCHNTPGSREKKSLRGSRKIFPRLSTNTPRTAESRLQPSLLRQRRFLIAHFRSCVPAVEHQSVVKGDRDQQRDPSNQYVAEKGHGQCPSVTPPLVKALSVAM